MQTDVTSVLDHSVGTQIALVDTGVSVVVPVD